MKKPCKHQDLNPWPFDADSFLLCSRSFSWPSKVRYPQAASTQGDHLAAAFSKLSWTESRLSQSCRPSPPPTSLSNAGYCVIHKVKRDIRKVVPNRVLLGQVWILTFPYHNYSNTDCLMTNLPQVYNYWLISDIPTTSIQILIDLWHPYHKYSIQMLIDFRHHYHKYKNTNWFQTLLSQV